MENITTVLIVDDEQMGREALEGVLFPEGYQLLFAENGYQAYELALEHLPDVILMDVMMPGTNGFDTCRMIRDNPLLSEIPILVVTALDDRTARITGLEAGADEFITKPFDRLEIRTRIRTITRLNRYRKLILERARFTWVVEQALEGYLILDNADQILFANQAAQNMLHMPTHTQPLNFFEFVHNQYKLEPAENWKDWSANSGDPLFLVQVETVHNPSMVLDVKVLELPIGEKQKKLIRITDATEKFALMHEVWSFNQVITNKLSGPVTQIRMAAELAHQQAVAHGLEDMAEITEPIILGAQRLESEIQDILLYTNISKLTSSGSEFLINDIEELVAEICHEMGVKRFSVKVDEELRPMTLPFSQRAIEVITREIVGNAKKFHPWLSPCVEINFSSYEQCALITFTDDGIHLSADQLHNTWQPYYQAENGFHGEVAGMGLGLSTVANLVWKVGGQYRMYNRSGQPGIVVELLLPAKIEGKAVFNRLGDSLYR